MGDKKEQADVDAAFFERLPRLLGDLTELGCGSRTVGRHVAIVG
jgi:hypothetical protein